MAVAGAADDALRLLAGVADAPTFRRLINTLSNIPGELFVPSRLSKPSAVGAEMSEFVQRVAESPRGLTIAEFPAVARSLNLEPVEGVSYGSPGVLRQLSPRGMRQMENNIEAIMDAEVGGRKGDPRFYYDLNELLGVSAPSVDRTLASYTFAPFSAGSAVRENVRRWQRFVENPEQFPGRFPKEGGTTAGGAWQDALRILGKENPTPEDLSTLRRVMKIGSFGENIAFPESSLRATVDRHAVKNALGLYMPDKLTPDLQDEATYRLFEKAFQNVAERRGMMPNEVQSAAWDTWRRINQANPGQGMIDATDFVPLQVSEIFNLAPQARRDALRYMLGDVAGKDEKFLRRASLS